MYGEPVRPCIFLAQLPLQVIICAESSPRFLTSVFFGRCLVPPLLFLGVFFFT